MITAASTLGIAAPGYFRHGIAAIGPFLIAAFSLSKSTFGLLLSAIALLGAVISPGVGTLADRIGGVRLMRWSFLVCIAVPAGMALSPTFPVLFAIGLVGGFVSAAANPATNTLVASYVPIHRRGFAVGVKQAGGPLGIAIAGVVLPPIASTWGWEWAMASAGALPIVGLTLLWLSGAQRSATLPRTPRADRPPLGSRIWRLAINAAAIGAGLGSMLGFIAVFAVDEVGIGETAAGAMLTVLGFVGFVARLVWGAIADRRPSSTGLLAAVGLSSVLAAVGIWSSGRYGVWVLVGSTILLGISAMSWTSVGMFAVINESSLERSGAASGVVSAGFIGGLSVGPVLFGALADLTGGYSASFVMVITVFALSAVAVTGARPT
jgi:nitrate/nitrite transporter NarK